METKDDLKTYAHELQKALTGLSGGGSEMFVKHGDDFRADIDACVARVRRRYDNAHTRLVETVHQRDAALSVNKQLLEALEEADYILSRIVQNGEYKPLDVGAVKELHNRSRAAILAAKASS